MLHLYLIRHADAVPRGDPSFADDDRPLTDQGKRQAEALGRALAERSIKFSAILCSPLPRAQQTVEGLLTGLRDDTPPVTYIAELRPGTKRKKLDREIARHAGESIALVGHEPDLGQFVGRLIGSKKASIVLAKAGVACVACSDPLGKGCGSLVWMSTPEWFGADGSSEPES